MPEISRFYGIIIFMVFGDHAPPHFHVRYGNDKAVFSIKELKLMKGSLPQRALSMVLEWGFQHRDELLKNWDSCQKHEHPAMIEPL